MRRTLVLAISISIPVAMIAAWGSRHEADTSVGRQSTVVPGAFAAASPEKTTVSPIERMGYVPSSVREKGIFPGRDFKPHRVLVAKRASEGKSCVVHIQGNRLDESCASDLFDHAPIHMLESFTTSDSGQPLTYQLVGVVDAPVVSVDVVDTQGVTRSATLSDRAMYFELSQSELAEGTKAARVLAYGQGSRLLSTIDLEPGS